MIQVTAAQTNLAENFLMKKDVTIERTSRLKPINHAGLYVVPQVAPDRRLNTSLFSALRQDAWTAVGTFMVSVMCLLLK